MTRCRVLVTGGTGFVGSALVSSLVKDGYEVAITSRSAFLSLHDQRSTVFTDDEQIVRTVANWQPEIIFHLATHYVGAHQLDHIGDLVQGNVRFGITIAEAAVIAGARLVYTASAWQRQEGRREPASLYAALKESMSLILDYYSRAAYLQFSQVFLYDSYGPQDPRKKVVALLMSAAANRTPVVLGTGDKLVNLSHVRDVVRGIRWVGDQEPGISDWTIRSDLFITIAELVDLVQQITEQAIKVEWDTGRDRRIEMFKPWIFGKKVPISDGIELGAGLRELWTNEWKGNSGSP